ncbi:MAG: hypothetical protein WCP20_24580, partial [Desulfuromonadales bacterium]
EEYEKGIEQGIELGIEKGIEKGIDQGIEIGEKKNRSEIARKMMQKGIAIDDVMEITGLSREEIEKVLP